MERDKLKFIRNPKMLRFLMVKSMSNNKQYLATSPWLRPKKQTLLVTCISTKLLETLTLIWQQLPSMSLLRYNKSLNQEKLIQNLYTLLQYTSTKSSNQIQTVHGPKKEFKKEQSDNKMSKLNSMLLKKEDLKSWKGLLNKLRMVWTSIWVSVFQPYYQKFCQRTSKSVFRVKMVFLELVHIQLRLMLMLIWLTLERYLLN